MVVLLVVVAYSWAFPVPDGQADTQGYTSYSAPVDTYESPQPVHEAPTVTPIVAPAAEAPPQGYAPAQSSVLIHYDYAFNATGGAGGAKPDGYAPALDASQGGYAPAQINAPQGPVDVPVRVEVDQIVSSVESAGGQSGEGYAPSEGNEESSVVCRVLHPSRRFS